MLAKVLGPSDFSFSFGPDSFTTIIDALPPLEPIQPRKRESLLTGMNNFRTAAPYMRLKNCQNSSLKHFSRLFSILGEIWEQRRRKAAGFRLMLCLKKQC